MSVALDFSGLKQRLKTERAIESAEAQLEALIDLAGDIRTAHTAAMAASEPGVADELGRLLDRVHAKQVAVEDEIAALEGAA